MSTSHVAASSSFKSFTVLVEGTVDTEGTGVIEGTVDTEGTGVIEGTVDTEGAGVCRIESASLLHEIMINVKVRAYRRQKCFMDGIVTRLTNISVLGVCLLLSYLS